MESAPFLGLCPIQDQVSDVEDTFYIWRISVSLICYFNAWQKDKGIVFF